MYILFFRRISAQGNWMEKLLLCVVFIYLFVDLFIYCLFVCLLFIYFKGAVRWVMDQLYRLALLERGWGWLFLWNFVAVLVD